MSDAQTSAGGWNDVPLVLAPSGRVQRGPAVG